MSNEETSKQEARPPAHTEHFIQARQAGQHMYGDRVSPMKVFAGILYLSTAISGLLWTLRLYLTGLYGAPFSWWYPVMLPGSLSLFAGALLTWFPFREWSKWLALFGSLLLAAFFVPAMIETLRAYFRAEVVGGSQLASRVLVVGLVVASALVSLLGALKISK
jgi:hypothetical protein